MLVLLSPAKKLCDMNTPWLGHTSQPVFLSKTAELIATMKAMSITDIAKLMHLSPALAELNYKRFQAFSTDERPNSFISYPAIFLFQGDVYQSLNASAWDDKAIEFAQTHLAILSGLYGLLSPLDAIGAYRLEMGTKIANATGRNLYDFWRNLITAELNKRLVLHQNPLLVNLASSEYFAAVNSQALTNPLLTIHFQEIKNNQRKVVGIHAKKARGAMANYIIQNRIDDTKGIVQFNQLNYQFCHESSDEHHFYFVRKQMSNLNH